MRSCIAVFAFAVAALTLVKLAQADDELDGWQHEWVECNARAGDAQAAYNKCVSSARTRETVAQCAASARAPVDAALAKCRATLDRRVAFRTEKLAALDRLKPLFKTVWFQQAAAEDVDTASARFLSEGAKLKALADADPDGEADGVKSVAEKVVPEFEAMAGIAAQQATREKTCRADKKCMAARAEKVFVQSVVVPLCEAMWGAQNAERAIVEEKANPSGVVDLNVLHSQGDALREYRRQIAALRPSYKTTRGHDLRRWQDEGACVEEAAKPQQ